MYEYSKNYEKIKKVLLRERAGCFFTEGFHFSTPSLGATPRIIRPVKEGLTDRTALTRAYLL